MDNPFYAPNRLSSQSLFQSSSRTSMLGRPSLQNASQPQLQSSRSTFRVPLKSSQTVREPMRLKGRVLRQRQVFVLLAGLLALTIFLFSLKSALALAVMILYVFYQRACFQYFSPSDIARRVSAFALTFAALSTYALNLYMVQELGGQKSVSIFLSAGLLTMLLSKKSAKVNLTSLKYQRLSQRLSKLATYVFKKRSILNNILVILILHFTTSAFKFLHHLLENRPLQLRLYSFFADVVAALLVYIFIRVLSGCVLQFQRLEWQGDGHNYLLCLYQNCRSELQGLNSKMNSRVKVYEDFSAVFSHFQVYIESQALYRKLKQAKLMLIELLKQREGQNAGQSRSLRSQLEGMLQGSSRLRKHRAVVEDSLFVVGYLPR